MSRSEKSKHRELYESIVAPLQSLSVHNFFDYKKNIEVLLSEIDDENLQSSHRRLYHTYLHHLIHKMPKDKDIDVYEALIQAVQKAAEDLLPEGSRENQSPLELPLSEDDRAQLEKEYSIKKPEKHIAYRGGYARYILRAMYNIPQPPGDRNLTRDCDIYIDKSVCDDERTIDIAYCNEEGKLSLPDFSTSSLADALQNLDCTCNEIIVTHDKISYSADALESLKSETITPSTGGNAITLLSHRYYTKEDERIYTAHTLYRVFKFLIHRKAHTIKLPSHNLDIENMHTLETRKYLLVLARQIYQLPEDEQIIARYRFGKILTTIGMFSIGSERNIFFHIDIARRNHPEIDITSPSSFDRREKANRMLRKYIRLAHLKEHGPSIDLDKYHLLATDTTKEITIPYDEIPVGKAYESFIKEYTQRHQKIAAEKAAKR